MKGNMTSEPCSRLIMYKIVSTVLRTLHSRTFYFLSIFLSTLLKHVIMIARRYVHFVKLVCIVSLLRMNNDLFVLKLIKLLFRRNINPSFRSTLFRWNHKLRSQLKFLFLFFLGTFCFLVFLSNFTRKIP